MNSLTLKEIVSEKLRAAALREIIAPRDFYDLDFIIRQGFNLTDKEVLKLFVKKIRCFDGKRAGEFRFGYSVKEDK